MEQILVGKTRSFALGVYALLKDLDPMRWQSMRKQALKQRIVSLESEVQHLYIALNELSHEREALQNHYPVTALEQRLQLVECLLKELSLIDLNDHLSYLNLLGLRKRLQRAYQGLSIIMEAYQSPIPNIRPSNMKRSLVHFASAMGILVMIESVPHFSWMIAIALAYFCFCWSCEFLKRYHPRMKEHIMRVFAPIAHPHEYDKVNSATWYGTALLGLSLMNPTLGVVGVTILGVADPVAAAVGRKYGKIQLPGNRTLEGSLAFWISGSLAAFLMLSWLHPLSTSLNTLVVASVAAAFGAIGELLGAYPDDNLTVPLASAAGAFLCLASLGL